MKILILLLSFAVYLQAQIENVEIENIAIGYDENSLLISWSVPIQYAGYYDWFNVFYAEVENDHINMLDSALYWFMTYDQCWDWEHSRTYKYSIKITPQLGWGAYKSTIRIGIMVSNAFDENGRTTITYGRLFLAPNILNKTPLQPDARISDSP